MTEIERSTRDYERWLGGQLDLLRPDVRAKHQKMSTNPLCFLRATFYRWMELWPTVCPELSNAKVVLSIGDLHVENFGTWRDAEGRLVWGINDFDEAYPLPWPNDLVRLGASAHLAINAEHLTLSRSDACDAILHGYADALARGGAPFVLADEHRALRKVATSKLRDPTDFWQRLASLATWRGSIPREVLTALQRALPTRDMEVRIVHRVAGLGSLGRHRFVALGRWGGGYIAREAKATAPSACAWACGATETTKHYKGILAGAVRVPDPFVRVHPRWIVRRLAPDCTRIELDDLPQGRDEQRLLYAMGFETGNVHLGSLHGRAKRILRDLRARPRKWLHAAVRRMAESIESDWTDWRKSQR
jgi:uncharacterized protein (DUF2252 family)